MQRAKISDLGGIGINADQPPFNLPPNAFSRGQNIRFQDSRLRNFGGREVQTAAPIEIYGLIGFNTAQRTTLWVEGGLNSVYVYDGTNHIDITRASGPYTTNEYTDRWTGGVQGDLGYLCNGHSDGPQQWLPIDTTQALVDMAYDPNGSPGSQTWQELNYRAYSMRSFAGTIFAMNVIRDTLVLPSTVQWCNFVAIGDTSTDWVPKPGSSAGEKTLGESTGNIIDARELRDNFIIYKEDGAWRCYFTGDANSPFVFTPLPEYVRIINRNCIGVTREFHVLASRDDVQIFDGNTFRSIFDDRWRKTYSEGMNAERLLTTYVSVLNKEQEVWVCQPTNSNQFPNRAIVWNYKDDTISVTDIPECRDMDEGILVSAVDDTFDSLTPDLTFDEDFFRFDQSPFQTSIEYMVGAHAERLSRFGEVPGDDNVARPCLAERTGIVLQDEGTGMQSIDGTNRLREIKLYMLSTSPVEVQVGGQLTPNGPVTWGPIQTFDPTTQTYVNFRVMFKYLAYRILSNALVDWEVTDIELSYQRIRRR